MAMNGKELMYVCALASGLEGRASVFVGGGSPAAATASLLAKELSKGRLRVTLLGSDRYNPMTDDLGEPFDMSATGRYDAFFVGGGQIDGEANINLVGIGKAPHFDIRWPGSRGTPHMYLTIPNAILFTRDHTRRALVKKVDFISAAGVSPDSVPRTGGPVALITPRCIFSFDRRRRRFSLASVHPGSSVKDVVENTGFEFDLPERVAQTPAPSADLKEALIRRVLPGVAELYPQYAANLESEIRGRPDAVSAPASPKRR